MPLVTLEDLSIGFRGPQLFDNVNSVIESRQRIGLLGRNGTGKTTLLKMLVGEVQPDSGSITLAAGTKIARLTQDIPADLTGSIESVVLAGQGTPDDHCTDGEDLWQIQHRVESTLSRMDLDGDADVETLSTGMKRRVLLAQAIASDPDILLLDEPTNHLDIPAILWLEKFLSRWKSTLIFITHDRSFLQNLATRIWEIDRGQLFDWSCDYQTFLRRKENLLAAQEKQDALFDKKLAEEEVWIRQGIKARRTRNEGRVRSLMAMRVERGDRHEAVGKAKLNLQDAQRSGSMVADIKEISFTYDDQTIVDQFSTTLMRGDKVGIIGPNGAGKTTLLKLLLGQLKPDKGTVRLGTNLQIAYFDQLRETLDPNQTVQENVGQGSDKVQVGEKTKHILGYLQDFLFTPERARTEVRFLSGGERNRALLARLMTQPANVIVLDEPTNDLDSETLELLEDQLAGFAGTLLMVSHDRTFLNNVVTSTIIFEPDGVNEYVGGYDDWQRAVARREEAAVPTKEKSKPKAIAKTKTAPIKKLSYNDQQDLDQLPKRIEAIDAEITTMHQTMGDSAYFQLSGETITANAKRLKELGEELSATYRRLEELM